MIARTICGMYYSRWCVHTGISGSGSSSHGRSNWLVVRSVCAAIGRRRRNSNSNVRRRSNYEHQQQRSFSTIRMPISSSISLLHNFNTTIGYGSGSSSISAFSAVIKRTPGYRNSSISISNAATSTKYQEKRTNMMPLLSSLSSNHTRSSSSISSSTYHNNCHLPLYHVAKITESGKVSFVTISITDLLKKVHARDLFSLALTSVQEYELMDDTSKLQRQQVQRARIKKKNNRRRFGNRSSPTSILPRKDTIVVSFGPIRAIVCLGGKGYIFDAHEPSIRMFAQSVGNTFTMIHNEETKNNKKKKNGIVDNDDNDNDNHTNNIRKERIASAVIVPKESSHEYNNNDRFDDISKIQQQRTIKRQECNNNDNDNDNDHHREQQQQYHNNDSDRLQELTNFFSHRIYNYLQVPSLSSLSSSLPVSSNGQQQSIVAKKVENDGDKHTDKATTSVAAAIVTTPSDNSSFDAGELTDITTIVEEAVAEEKEDQYEKFELIFLEEILRDVCGTYNRRLLLYEPIVDDIAARVSNEMYTTSSVNRLVPIKNSLQEFELNIQSALNGITTLLNDDDDMIGLLLSERFEASLKKEILEINRHESVELLLEEYARQLSNTLHETSYLLKKVQSEQELIAMSLDSYRNKIVTMNLYLSITGISIAMLTAVAGFYGMNLTHGYEHAPQTMFYNVVSFSTIGGVLFGVGCVHYIRSGFDFSLDGSLTGNSYRRRSERLREIDTIDNALNHTSMAALDYTLKYLATQRIITAASNNNTEDDNYKNNSIHDDNDNDNKRRMTKDEFKSKLYESLSGEYDAISDSEVDLLFNTLDVTNDGTLNTSDFRSSNTLLSEINIFGGGVGGRGPQYGSGSRNRSS